MRICDFYIFLIFAGAFKMSGRMNSRLMVLLLPGNKIKREAEDRIEGFYFHFIYLALLDFL